MTGVAIAPIGKPFSTDERGRFVNEASASRITGRWAEALAAAEDAVTGRLAPAVVGLYVRGSVAGGAPIDFVSDIDLVAIVRNGASANAGLGEAVSSEIHSRFPFVVEVELTILEEEALFRPENLEQRFLIKTSGVLRVGADVLAELPAFEPTRELASGLHGGVGEALGRGRRAILDGTPELRARACRWLMKRFLRTGSALVMEEEGTYARDLHPAFRLFARHYPERERAMAEALAWAIEPTPDRDALLAFLDDFGGWLTEEAGRKLSIRGA